MAQNTPQLDIGTYTDVGQVRSRNEDSLRIYPEPHPAGQLFVVADGVGGENYGQEASQLAVQRIGDLYYKFYEQYPNQPIEHTLKQVLVQVNTEIYETAVRMGSAGHMGTTAVVAVIRNRILTVAWVGDSRVYVVSHKKGIARQITIDHSQVEDEVRAGLLTREEADRHPERNVLSRSLGGSPMVEPEAITGELEERDLVVLCSDGLTRYVDKTLISQHVLYHPTSQVSADTLGDMANQAGGKDNISVIVVHLGKRQTEVETVMPLSAPPPMASPYTTDEKPSTSSGVVPEATLQNPKLAQSQIPFWQTRNFMIGAVILVVISFFVIALIVAGMNSGNDSLREEQVATETDLALIQASETIAANVNAQAEALVQASQTIDAAVNLTATTTALADATIVAGTETAQVPTATSTPNAIEIAAAQLTQDAAISNLTATFEAVQNATTEALAASGEVVPGTTLYAQRDTFIGISAGQQSIAIQRGTAVLVTTHPTDDANHFQFNGYYHVRSDAVSRSGWVPIGDLDLQPPSDDQPGDAAGEGDTPPTGDIPTGGDIPNGGDTPNGGYSDRQAVYVDASRTESEVVYLQSSPTFISFNNPLSTGASATIIGLPEFSIVNGEGQWWWQIRLEDGTVGYLEDVYLTSTNPTP